MSDRSRLPPPRLLLIGVLLAAVFSAVDHWLLAQLQAQQYTTTRGVLTMGAFVAQVGLLGWLCGKFLENPWWRWGFYVWGWVLIDLQLFATSGFAVSRLTNALFAAQVGLTIIWAILGTTHWNIRLPACAVLATLLVLIMPPSDEFGQRLFPIQMIALAGLCLVLRWRRFKLMPIETADERGVERVRQMQFSIRHLLIWTTSLAIVLGALRALDLLSLQSVNAHFERRTTDYFSAGLLMAIAHIISLWAALGSGSPWLRWPVFALTLPLIGLAIGIIEDYFQWIRWSRNFTISVLWRESSIREDLNGFVIAVSLAGSFLVASLVILRILGFRLARNSKPRPAASDS